MNVSNPNFQLVKEFRDLGGQKSVKEFIAGKSYPVDMTIDKTFVEDFATIKTTLGLSVKLINQNN